MINPVFNTTRQAGAGAAVTYGAAQQTLHAIHQVMATDPLFAHVVYHHVIPHHVAHHYVIYPTDFSTIPFGSTYYL
ncbi:hypothetical protein ACIGHG_02240 [Bacillus sp. NPDC077411]|uniref:DUF3947 family protein n=1 Tax=Bacillus bruguierae TaxID=3127667 RepID=A0ABU8FHY7_9BACI|nr:MULTISPECIES: hypothetical protein [unclassified Bacillus (in: firmicutes)]SFJ07242.1 hypothetical protein SAMN04488574_10684 [Bacillus sp. 71mf]SFS67764.1 hypothetical protein SAMN04488145_102375 [Bacillus sp. 103mf]